MRKRLEKLSEEEYNRLEKLAKNLKDIDGTTIIEYGEGFMTFLTARIEQAIARWFYE